MMKLKRVCGYCGGDGRLRDGSTYCPHCDTHAKDAPVSLYEIPHREFTPYMEVMSNKRAFNLAEFDAYHNHLKGASEFTRYRIQICDIISKVLKGEVPTTSCLIYMDNPDFIDRFASTYLCTAYKAGLTIFPFLDTLTLHQLKTDRNFALPKDIYGDITFFDAVNADILCIELVPQIELFASIRITQYLLRARARINKPTIIFTSRSGSELFKPELCNKVDCVKELRQLVKSHKDNPSSCGDLLYIGLDATSKIR